MSRPDDVPVVVAKDTDENGNHPSDVPIPRAPVVIERFECPEHGVVSDQGSGPRKRWCARCGDWVEAITVEYVRAGR